MSRCIIALSVAIVAVGYLISIEQTPGPKAGRPTYGMEAWQMTRFELDNLYSVGGYVMNGELILSLGGRDYVVLRRNANRGWSMFVERGSQTQVAIDVFDDSDIATLIDTQIGTQTGKQ